MYLNIYRLRSELNTIPMYVGRTTSNVGIVPFHGRHIYGRDRAVPLTLSPILWVELKSNTVGPAPRRRDASEDRKVGLERHLPKLTHSHPKRLHSSVTRKRRNRFRQIEFKSVTEMLKFNC